MGRNVLIVGVIGILIILGIGLYNSNKTTQSGINFTPVYGSPTPAIEMDKLQAEDIKIGTGSAVKTGDKVEVNYTGTLTNGNKFDSSYDHRQTFTFTVGAGEVIQGWDEGLIGMKQGGVRKLTIPPSLGYGNQSIGSIPPNSTLIFEIELISINP